MDTEKAKQLKAEEVKEFRDSDKEVEKKARRLAELIRAARHMVILTGAGISCAAGIPDYRSATGRWTMEEMAKLEGNENKILLVSITPMKLLFTSRDQKEPKLLLPSKRVQLILTWLW
jgi:hypothetical protein